MQPDNSYANVAVIGSGIAGCLTAWLLAEGGLRVTVIEKAPDPFSGTSTGAIQCHLGGLYPGSRATASQCLRGAIELKRNLPEGLLTRTIKFLVAESSKISLDEYLAFYSSLRDEYAELPVEDHVFGPAEDFFRPLDAHEYGFARQVQGGIATQEPLLNVATIRRALLERLASMGVRILSSTEVVEAQQAGDRYELSLLHPDGTSRLGFDQVINAGGYLSQLLNHQLGDRTQYILRLKSWQFVQPDLKARSIPPFMVVSGGYLHYSPVVDEGLACLQRVSSDGSYVDEHRPCPDSPDIPAQWDHILQTGQVPGERRRLRNSIEYANDTFLPEAKFEPIASKPGVTVSYDSAMQNRAHQGVHVLAPGWQAVVPTKFTSAINLALDASRTALDHARLAAE